MNRPPAPFLPAKALFLGDRVVSKSPRIGGRKGGNEVEFAKSLNLVLLLKVGDDDV
jgi:hypothetical protein